VTGKRVDLYKYVLFGFRAAGLTYRTSSELDLALGQPARGPRCGPAGGGHVLVMWSTPLLVAVRRATVSAVRNVPWTLADGSAFMRCPRPGRTGNAGAGFAAPEQVPRWTFQAARLTSAPPRVIDAAIVVVPDTHQPGCSVGRVRPQRARGLPELFSAEHSTQLPGPSRCSPPTRGVPIEDQDRRAGEATTRYNIAMIHWAAGNLDQAIGELEFVVNLDRQVGHPDLTSDTAALEQVAKNEQGLGKRLDHLIHTAGLNTGPGARGSFPTSTYLVSHP
jgi:hypothetical protein